MRRGAGTYPASTRALAQRLERAEATASAALVDARREVQPRIGAEWIEVAGVYAMFDGAASPVTQTFGAGVFDLFLEPEFDRIEAFFDERGASTCHEVCSFAAPETVTLLSARGYSPIEASTVLVRPTATELPIAATSVSVRVLSADESSLWSRIAAEGWGHESAELGDFVRDLASVTAHARGAHCFLAELNGEPIAAAGLSMGEGIALLAGATTIPAARRQGAQQALLRARLDFAVARGIDLAMVVTQPGSASQRNAERQGFRPAYVRAKWQRPLHATRAREAS